MQQGWGPPQQGPSGWGTPQHPGPYPHPGVVQPAPVGPPPTVWGTPLAPGERVVYFHRRDGTGEKILLIVLGVIFLVGIIGIVFLLIGIFAKPQAWVVTTHRYMHIERGKPAKFIAGSNVRRVIRKQSGSIVKWIELLDANGQGVSLQVACNPPGFDPMITRYLDDPRALQVAPSVPYEA